MYNVDEYYDRFSYTLFMGGHEYGTSSKPEKRNSKRISVNLLANCETTARDVTGGGCLRFLSYTKDLSPTGGKFIIGEDVKVGQHLTISLELPVNFMPLLIDGEVVWVKKIEGFDFLIGDNVETGVRFVRLDSRCDEEKLKNYLSSG